MPVAEPCPKCGAPFIVEKKTKIGRLRSCLKEGCDWESVVADAQQPQPEEATPVGAKP
jgi:DNA topoisomerase-1